MSTRHNSRTTAGRRAAAAGRYTPYSLYRRALRLEPLEDRRLLAVVTVNTLSDTTDLSDNLTTLREAIFATNLVAGADTIDFAPALTASGPASILLTQGELKITDALTISGPGASLLTIDASGSDPTPLTKTGDGARVFNIDNGNNSTLLDASISGLRLTGGDAGTSLGGGAILSSENLWLTEIIVVGNTATRGGGIASRFGGLSLVDSTVANNVARLSDGGGIRVSDSTREFLVTGSTITNNVTIANSFGYGGGISSGLRTTIQDSTISGNSSMGAGGGIRTIGILTVRNSVIDNNTSNAFGNAGGGIFNSFASVTIIATQVTNNKAPNGEGGGVRKQFGSLLIEDSTFSGNYAKYGAGISASDDVSVQISRTTITNNSTPLSTATGIPHYVGFGGGVFVVNGTLSIADSDINGNRSGDAAGLYGRRSDIRITRTNVIGNYGKGIATDSGHLIVEASTVSDNSGWVGGGIAIFDTIAEVVNSTISNNTASIRGGGIFNSGGELTLRFSTVTGNEAPVAAGGGVASLGNNSTRTDVQSTIIAGNVNGDVDLVTVATTNSFHSLEYNVIGTGNAIASFNQAGDQTGVLNPLLGPLADNGGPTFTHALLAGSPAINAGDLAAVAGVNGVPEFDQRGMPFGRVFNGRIDIGAFEYQQASDLNLLVDTLVDENDGNYGRGDLSLREAIALANMWPSVDTIRFDPTLAASGPATILLVKGELKITSSMTIAGLGADVLTIDARGNNPTPTSVNGDGSRVFNIDDGATTASLVIISGLTLTGGEIATDGGAVFTRESLALVDMIVDRNYSTSLSTAGTGGGITAVLREGAVLVVVRSQITNNQSTVRGAGMSLDVGAGSAVLIYGSQIVGNSKRLPVGISPTSFAGGGIYIVNSGGTVTIDNSLVSDNISDGNGGGISFSGPLTIQRTTIANNSTLGLGGGIHFRASTGGGLSLFDSTVTDNEAGSGGGIALSGSNTSANTIARSQIASNSAERIGANFGFGGGIYFDQGSIRITDSTIRDNIADVDGGGIATTSSGIFQPSFLMEGSTVAFNSAATNGGGMSLGRGGTIWGSTVRGNSARTGGAIYATGAAVMPTNIEHSTVAHNEASISTGGVYVSAGPLNLNHSIVALNTSPGPADDLGRGGRGQITAAWSLTGDNNGSGLVEAPVGAADVNGNLIGGTLHGLIDPLLRPLADYGGSTHTLALAPGSPAINAGNPSAAAGAGGVPIYDQRGLPFDRVIGGRIDIGAFEFHTPPGLSLVVDTLVDESDSNYSVGDLSLREAIQLANLAPDENTILFDPALTAGGPATIQLSLGELGIVGGVSIVGPGADLLTIDASGNDSTPAVNDGLGSSIFEIGDGADDLFDVSISDLTLTGGDSQYGGAIVSTENLTITGSKITGNAAVQLGGGVAQIYGSLHISDSIISHNESEQSGGGIAVSGAEVIVEDTTISDNLAGVGGGIHAYDAQLSVANATITNNSALGGGGAGGGIYHKLGKLTVTDSTISGNTSISGGGVYSDGEAEIVRSTLDGNYGYLHGGGIYSFGKLLVRETTISASGAGLDGAGIHVAGDVLIDSSTLADNDAGRHGGAIWVEVVDGALTIVNSTISGNSADNEGGGVWITGTDATATIAHSTIVENSSHHLFGFGGGVVLNLGSLQLDHTIVAANAAKTGADLFTQVDTNVSARYSLIGNAQDTGLTEAPVGLPNANGNLIGGPVHGVIDPLLGPLADNGGLTFTHALLAGSPAINSGDLSVFAGMNGIPQFDQRGTPFGRVGRVDIGAFEYQQTSNLILLVDTLVDENDGNYSRGDLSLREAIALADVWPDDDTIHFAPELIASGPATILLTQGELRITTPMSIVGLGADVLTIDASGSDPTPTAKDGQGSRVFAINYIGFSVDCSLAGLTLTGGDVANNGGAIQTKNVRLTLEDMVISGNASLASGGGISSDRSELKVFHSTVTNNRAGVGGGGMLVSSGELVTSDSTISGNVVLNDKGIGGGIYFRDYARRQRFEITNSTISNNSAPLVGGGIAARFDGGAPRITNSQISGNTSLSELGPRGAGLYLFGNGTLTIESSRIHDNSVNSIGRGGGIFSAVNLRLNTTTVASNFGGVDGGGIHSVGNLWLTDCIVTQNATVNSAGGGGISMASLSSFQVTGSTISNNQGSGIRQLFGYLTIFTSAISGNSTSQSGGGIYTGAGVANIFISQSEIRDNRAAGSGGGIYKSGGELDVFDSTIASNTAGGNGGGVASIANEDSYTSSTITGNEAAINGGGVWANAVEGFAYSTITLNKASGTGGGVFLVSGNTLVKNTIVARNTASSGVDLSGLLGAHFEARNSLIGSSQGSGLPSAPVGSPDASGNLIGGVNANDFIDPKLAPLAMRGGPTRTHALLAGSPAINAGDPSAFGAPAFDQRGTPFARVFGGRIDIGAFEVQPDLPVGDFNQNGIVDGADYTLWRNTVGSTSDFRADGNGDGKVDNADYGLWRANFGNVRLPQFASIAVQSAAVAVGAPPINSVLRTANRDVQANQAVAPQVQQTLAGAPAAKPRMRAVQRVEGVEQASVGLLAWLSESEAAQKAVRQLAREGGGVDPPGAETPIESDDSADALDEAFAGLSSD